MRRIDAKLAYRLFYPQVPMIICASYKKEVAAMTANSCIPVSDSPPLVCVAVNRKSRTNRILNKSQSFSINWLDYANRALAQKLATHFAPSLGSDKLEQAGASYHIVHRVPVISKSCAFAICRVQSIIQTGDHDLFIGKIILAKACPDFQRSWKFRKYGPLLYLGSDKKEQFATI